MDIARSAASAGPTVGAAPAEHGGAVRELVLTVSDLARSTAFWEQALSAPPERGQETPWSSFALAPGLVLLLLPATEGGVAAAQVQLGLSPRGPSAAYVERLVRLGARVSGAPGEGAGALSGATVLHTPDGVSLVVHRR